MSGAKNAAWTLAWLQMMARHGQLVLEAGTTLVQLTPVRWDHERAQVVFRLGRQVAEEERGDPPPEPP